jgi:hypothetical protein
MEGTFTSGQLRQHCGRWRGAQAAARWRQAGARGYADYLSFLTTALFCIAAGRRPSRGPMRCARAYHSLAPGGLALLDGAPTRWGGLRVTVWVGPL